jgi:hypothetical protein
MFKKNFWAKPAFLLPVLLAAALLAGCPGPTDPVTPQPPAKPVITSVTPGDTSLTVTWGAASEATSYEVYYHTSNTTTGATKFATEPTGTSVTITGLNNDTLYYVWVKAKNSGGSSDFSQSMSGTPTDIPADLDRYFQSLPWSAAYAYYDDGFTVDSSAKTFYYYGDSTFDKKWGGPIVKIVEEDGAYIMIVEITEATGDWSPPPETGKYFAAAYKNLTSFAVNFNTPFKVGGNNTGTTTIGEAVSEYTIANGYFDYLSTTLYYPHTASAITLASLQGDWVTEDLTDDPDYFIQIKGTKLTEWLDDGDGVYDVSDDSGMLAELGDIVDHTDTSQNSGVLYVKIIASDMGFNADKYIAVAWNNKSGSSVQFHTNGGPGNAGYDTLEAIKAALNDVTDTDQFDLDDFYDYTK